MCLGVTVCLCCVDIMRHSDVFEGYCLFTLSDIHIGKTLRANVQSY